MDIKCSVHQRVKVVSFRLVGHISTRSSLAEDADLFPDTHFRLFDAEGEKVADKIALCGTKSLFQFS